MVKIIVYTDGATSNNQSKENFGGWGAVIMTSNSDKEKQLFGSAINTSNNKMELTAPIKALEKIKSTISRTDVPIMIYSDSAYVVNGMNDWVKGWKSRGWRKSDKKPVENVDLWIELDNLRNYFDDVSFTKVRGHAGDKYNEVADQLANKGVKQAKEGLDED